MRHAVIVAAARTAIGRARPGGAFAETRPDDLLAHVLRGVVDQAGIDPASIDDLVVGQTIPVAEGDQVNATRVAAALAGIPDTVPACSVNRQCGSSLQAIRVAAHAIVAGEADVYLVGGVDSVSRTAAVYPDWVHHPRVRSGELPDFYMAMGETAERVADVYRVSREDMDRFALQSQQRAAAAQAAGFFDREVVPFTRADGGVVAADESVRPGTSLEALAALPPAFREDGRVTAGNSCPLNDGAAAVLLMSAERAAAEGLQPLARVRASAVSGLAPELMGVGPIEAVRAALARAGLSVGDVDVLELNEAFASQVIAVARELGVDPFGTVLNPHGGAIALGHPFGMTGARMMATLLNDLRTLDGTIGVETMCVGGGQGIAMVVERLV